MCENKQYISEVAISWFSSNKMIVNPDKIKTIILTKNKWYTNWVFYWYRYCLHWETCKTFRNTPRQPSISIHLHINTICKSTSNQLNALVRLKKFLSFEEKKVLVNGFTLPNFVPWYGLSHLLNLWKMLKIYKNVPFDFYRMTIKLLWNIVTQICINNCKCAKS